jgi:hypothetical protein
MSVVKGQSNKLPPPATPAAEVVFKWNAQSRRRDFRRRLIMLLYAGWVPQRPLFAWGFPCLPAGVDVHRPRRFPLGLPTVGLTAGPVHIEFVDAPFSYLPICLADKQR